MEKESFEDKEVADMLNNYFVSIKVDREERPDIDTIYMAVCQSLTGHGGWPLTVIMTPDRKPFFAGTYFPKQSKWGKAGLIDILSVVKENWEHKREEISSYGEEITSIINQRTVEDRRSLSKDVLKKAYTQLENSFDNRYGGFGTPPKFPMPHNLMFLLRYHKHFKHQKALQMVEKTLTSMHQGGIFDHVGYGFARYSTDDRWLIPHFEKMLYDNALLCYTWLEAYQCTENKEFAQVATKILTYVLRDMTDEEGGFYSAEDADSEGSEGKFYTFTRAEVFNVLGEKDGEIFADYYDITAKGNFEHNTSILNVIGRNIYSFAKSVDMSVEDVQELLENCREKLFQYREQRVHPYKDDKILSSWNGLMIAAFAKASRVLERPMFLQVACKAVEFVLKRLVRKDGRLLARYRDGEAAYPAYLDDHAFLLWAFLEVYEATLNKEYLRLAVNLAQDMKRLFWDEDSGGFYFYGTDAEQLISRPKELYDGAVPSGNSVAILALLKLGDYMEDQSLISMAEQAIEFFSGEVSKYPQAYTYFLMALDYYWFGRKKLLVVGRENQQDVWAMIRTADQCFLPDTIIDCQLLEENKVQNEARAYICEDFNCKPLNTNIEEFAKYLKRM